MTAHARFAEMWPEPLPGAETERILSPQQCDELVGSSRSTVPLSAVWSELVTGRWKLLDCSFTGQRAFMTLRGATCIRADPRLAPRKVRVLERVLLGEGQKAVALALDVAPSTVTLMSGECLRAMGLACRTSRVPMPLVMVAHAAKGCTTYREGALAELTLAGVAHRVIGVPLPDAGLSDLLSPAECAVTRLLIEGYQHAEMARARATSTRTIANQLAAAFHKLNVSGRAELLCRLIRNVEPDPTGKRLTLGRFSAPWQPGGSTLRGAGSAMTLVQRSAVSS